MPGVRLTKEQVKKAEQLLKKKGATVEAVAVEIGASPSTVQTIKNGHHALQK